MKNPPYFIVGLPRSRTAWLANLLTHGKSFCWHEASRYVSTIGDLKKKLDETEGHFVGNADSNLMNMPSVSILAAFPDSKFIFVQRRWVEAVKSYCKAFPEFNHWRVEKSFMNLEENLTDLQMACPSAQVMVVKYNDLDNVDVCRSLWWFACPGEPFPVNRCEMLQQMRVDTIFSKMEAAMHPDYQAALKQIRTFQSVLP